MRVAGGYAVTGGLYILVSDFLVRWFIGERNSEAAWWMDFLLDGAFVTGSTLVTYAVVGRVVARFQAQANALTALEQRWRFALEEHGVWEWNAGRRGVFYFPSSKSLHGFSEAEINEPRYAWERRIHPDDRETVRREIRRHYRGEAETFTCQYRLRTRDGGYAWVLARGRLVQRDARGRPLRGIGIISDISAQKRVEQQLLDSRNLAEAIINASTTGILTYRADGQAMSVNPAAMNLLGATREQVLEKNFYALKTWREQGLIEMAERALRDDIVAKREGSFESSFGRKSWVDMTFLPFTHAGERRLLLLVHETTHSHEVEARLELMHSALEATPTGWVITDANGLIEWVNPAFTQMTGYSLEEVVGKTPKTLKSGRHTAGFYAHLWDTVRAGRIWQGEISNRRKDGTIYFERMTIAPVREAGGAITHYVAMKEDITGRRELESQLERAQRLESIGLLASGIAHDLNNVLAPIMLSLSLVKSLHADAPTREMLDSIQAAAQRGAGIVKQVLTFARGMEGVRQPLDLRPLIKEMVIFARETFPREIRVVLTLPSGELMVEGDVTQLHQVLLNLAINSRDAMPEGGVLTLKAEIVQLDAAVTQPPFDGRNGPFVKVSVSDTGTGMTPEVMARIFEPFFTTKPRGRGTGLGLSTVYGLVRSHGGLVDVRSQPGQGTTFEVFLPSVAATAQAVVASEKVSQLDGVRRRVLVVDDEKNIRVVVGELLRKRNFDVLLAEDGIEALRRLRETPDGFAVGIVDLMMPGMSGYKLIAEMRRLSPALPIVVASGMAGDLRAGEDRAALDALGVKEFLSKPFFEADLLASLERALPKPVATIPS